VAVAVYVVFLARRVTMLEREVRLMNEVLDRRESAAR
jgi:hypothetical protein